MNQEIIKYCFERGVLLDKEVLGLFSETGDINFVKLVIEKIQKMTSQKIITKNFFESRDKVVEVFSEIPSESRKNLEKLRIKLGLSIEISKAVERPVEKIEKGINSFEISKANSSVVVLPVQAIPNKKLEVSDFTRYFRNRFLEMRGILQEHSELGAPVSIGRISGQRQSVSVIGIVSKRKTTKNKNIIFEIEDLTGKINVLISKDRKELIEKAEEVALDSVIGFKGFGNSEIIFTNDLIFPDSVLPERKKSSIDECALFIGDIHFGSKKFMEEGFLKFIDYLSEESKDPESMKVKYLFITGDLVTGVGNYPTQEEDLKIKDLEEQYEKITEILGRVRKDIKIIISPGNHDGVRLMEPQPVLDEKYAWPLQDLDNVILTESPSTVNIGAGKNFSGFNVLTYHGFSFPFYANSVPRLMLKKSMNTPEEIMKYLLKNRHLAPTHASVQYFPLEKDPLIISEIPDIFVSSHTHKSAVTYYNNILVISTSCWEEMTPYQEKFGNIPDHCKVPMFNLKTRAVKILDFE